MLPVVLLHEQTLRRILTRRPDVSYFLDGYFSLLSQRCQTLQRFRKQFDGKPIVTDDALPVLLVADDRALLRRLSQLLSMFGYEVSQAASNEQAQAAISCRLPAFILVDANMQHGAALDFCRCVMKHEHAGQMRTMLLVSEPPVELLSEALEAGVEDFLQKPIIYGEVLARLRAGGRALENERRIEAQRGVDSVTGLMSQPAFYDRVDFEVALLQRASGGIHSAPPVSCAVISLDHFGRVEMECGLASSNTILQDVATQLSDCVGEDVLLGSLGDNRVAALLTNHSENEAANWATSVQQMLRDTMFHAGNGTYRFTASIGVAGFTEGPQTTEEFIVCATQAMELARASGGDCIACSDEFEDEASVWEQLAAPGSLFETTIARDVMHPCTVWIHESDTLQTAAKLVRRTQLPAVPVLNDAGKVSGLLTREALEQELTSGDRLPHQCTAGEVGLPRPICEASHAPFNAVLENFSHDPQAVVLVLDQERPTGIITLANVASLSGSVTRETFYSDAFGSNSRYLVVPENAELQTADSDD